MALTLSFIGLLLGAIALLIVFLGYCQRARVYRPAQTLLMVSPDDFTYNAETAASNAFEHDTGTAAENRQRALAEFQQMVAQLRERRIRVLTLTSNPQTPTPDAVFPNNWFISLPDTIPNSTHLIFCPMLAPNRRAERQPQALQACLHTAGIAVTQQIDLSHLEQAQMMLEGTGSIVFDHQNKIAYACPSPRTHLSALNQLAQLIDYTPMVFTATDPSGQAIYHTNIVLSIGPHHAVICDQAITDLSVRAAVLRQLEAGGKRIICIDPQQMRNMCGNILTVRNQDGKSHIVLSRTAYDHFTEWQRRCLARFGKLVIVDIPTIETVGGGSSRCMLAEIYHS